jgi:hypothetical protein
MNMLPEERLKHEMTNMAKFPALRRSKQYLMKTSQNVSLFLAP